MRSFVHKGDGGAIDTRGWERYCDPCPKSRVIKEASMFKSHAPSSVLVLTLAISFWLYGQSDTGLIRGAVTDTSGAVVPGGRITVTDERTNVTAFSAVADEAGRYT